MTNLPVVAHARLGASKAERWINCPGSVRMCRGLPDIQSTYAMEGTTAHDIASRCLEKNLDPDVWLDDEVKGVRVDDDMVQAVQIYVDHVRKRQGELGAELMVETRFDLSPLNPPGEMFGTADVVLNAADFDTRWLEIIDYKHGVGVSVDADENAQLLYYALGALLALRDTLEVRPEFFRVTIVQPRGFHSEGIIRSFDFNYAYLVSFKKKLFEAAARTGEPNAPLAVGPWCRFCPALATCPEQEAAAVALVQAEFEALPVDMPPPPERLTIEQLTTVLDKAKIVEDWIRSVYAHVQLTLEAGESVPGWKLVPRRATRKWKSAEEAAAWCEEHVEDPYQDPKLKSPAQIEKELKAGLPHGHKKDAADILTKSGHVVQESSGNTIAPTSDARLAISTTSAEDEFTPLPAGGAEEEE